jgi:hypothetical protein
MKVIPETYLMKVILETYLMKVDWYVEEKNKYLQAEIK